MRGPGSILAIAVEGLGSGASGLYRLATDSGPTGYIDCLRLWPQEIATTVSFLDNSSTISGMSVTLEAHPAIARYFFSLLPTQIATFQGATALDYELTVAGTDIKLDSSATGLAGSVVCLERECIIMGTHSGLGQYAGCTRGAHETFQAHHSADGADKDLSVFSADDMPILLGRRIRLIKNDYPHTTETTLWTGIISEVSAPSPDLIRISADSTLSAMSDRSILKGMLKGPPPGRPGWIQVASGHPAVPDGLLSITVDKGKGALSFLSYAEINSGIAEGNIHVLFRKVAYLDNWLDLPMTMGESANLREFREFIFASGDSSTAPHRFPLSSNVFTLTLQILMISQGGANYDLSGTVGRYDAGAQLSKETVIGLAIPWQMIDVAGIEALRDSFGAFAWRDKIYIGIDGEPVKALEFIQKKLLGPLACVLTARSDGLITIVRMKDSTGDSIPTIDATSMIVPPMPAHSRNLNTAIDKVEVSFDHEVGKGPRTDVFINGPRRNRHPFSDRSTLHLDLSTLGTGIQANGQGGESLARFLAIRLAARYAAPIPSIDIKVTRDQDVEIGDLVKVTHDKIYTSTTGTRGVTDQKFLCVGRRLNVENATLSLRLLDVGAAYLKTSLISPAARVESYNAGTRVFTLTDEHFNEGQDDTVGFKVGYKIILTQHTHLNIITGGLTLEIEATGTNTITIDSASNAILIAQAITPALGNLLTFPLYDQASLASEVRTTFTFMADATSTLGAGNETPSQWSF